MLKEENIQTIKSKFEGLSHFLNEKSLRMWAAVESQSLGHGGVSMVSKATGLSRTTIHAGMNELNRKEINSGSKQRLRKIGGGRKKLTEKTPEIIQHLEALVEPVTRGDPESSLRWTCKSTAILAEELQKRGFSISQRKVWGLLSDLGYSLQSNKKTKEGDDHPDRDMQFFFIYEKIKKFQKACLPVISVDTKKKELIGEYKNNGREWQPKGQPIEVNGHDFPDKELGKVAPYGVYDITANKGWVSVGIDHDTAEFAVASIRRWWREMGQIDYMGVKDILITADCGGSNGYRVRLWKSELQKLANELNIRLHVSHLPPGTSKWNKIEHRMFSYISKNWRGKPLTSREVVVNLISNTKTKTGLEIKAGLDANNYQKGIKISDKEFESILVEKDKFHGDWNYQIIPNLKNVQVINS